MELQNWRVRLRVRELCRRRQAYPLAGTGIGVKSVSRRCGRSFSTSLRLESLGALGILVQVVVVTLLGARLTDVLAELHMYQIKIL